MRRLVDSLGSSRKRIELWSRVLRSSGDSAVRKASRRSAVRTANYS